MKLVNIRDYPGKEMLNEAFGDKWVYIGRRSKRYGLPGSPLANPYSHLKNTAARWRVATRDEAVIYYRAWLWRQIRADRRDVIDALKEINEDSVLVCWCWPQPCHGLVVKNAATWYNGTHMEF